jgi:tetratricopeptide (TPR) repeat protein
MRKCFTCLAFLWASVSLSYLHAQEVQPDTAGIRQQDSTLGSPFRLFTNATFITFIGELSAQTTAQAMAERSQLPALQDQYFRDFAREHQLSPEQVYALMNSWVRGHSVPEEEADMLLQGARQYYLRQYHASSLYYEQAAGAAEEGATASATYLLAGNSAVAGGNYQRAIRLYRMADSVLVLPAPADKTYASLQAKKYGLQGLLAAALLEAGSQLGDQHSYEYLAAAALLEKNILARYQPATAPVDWAKTQCRLGTIWQLLGDQAIEPAAGDSLFMLAISAYNDALTVYTQKDLPVDWARMQHHLGVVLSKLGATKDAIASFRSAQGIFTLQNNPRDWASTAYHLGNMLQCQAGKAKEADGIDLFAQSAIAYRQALEVYTAITTPEEWGWAQHNLGVSLFEQGRREGGRGLLSLAAAAFKQALTVRTKDCYPADWASTQYNLGTALWEESGRAAGDNVTLLAAAAKAYEAAQTYYTPKGQPEQWFNVQNGLGLIYEQQKEWMAAIEHFENLRDMEPMYATQKVTELRRKAGK